MVWIQFLAKLLYLSFMATRELLHQSTCYLEYIASIPLIPNLILMLTIVLILMLYFTHNVCAFRTRKFSSWIALFRILAMFNCTKITMPTTAVFYVLASSNQVQDKLWSRLSLILAVAVVLKLRTYVLFDGAN
jgi:hypothetical protein